MFAPGLLAALESVYAIALAAWVGAILFFSFGVAPIIFRVLAPDQAAKFVRALFPRYYAWGSYCGAIALASYIGGVMTHPELRGPRVLAVALPLLVGTLIMLYCGNGLTPAINSARDAGPEQKGKFDRLHKLSVRLNGVVLLAGLALLVAFAVRPRPGSSGMVELTPEQRAERSYQSGVRTQQSYDEAVKRYRSSEK